MNNKLTDELKKNVEIIQSLQTQIQELNSKIMNERVIKANFEEEIENLTEGLARITGFVFSLPAVKSNPEENSIVESTIKAISVIYEGNCGKRVLNESENFENYKAYNRAPLNDNMKYKKK